MRENCQITNSLIKNILFLFLNGFGNIGLSKNVEIIQRALVLENQIIALREKYFKECGLKVVKE